MVVEADSARLRGVLGAIKRSIGSREPAHWTERGADVHQEDHEEVTFQCTLTNVTNFHKNSF